MLIILKKHLKKYIYRFLNLPTASESAEARLTWKIVLDYLFSRRSYLVGLAFVSAAAAAFEGATMAALGLAVSVFVDSGAREFPGVPENVAKWLNELLFAGQKEKAFIAIVSVAVLAQVLKSVLLYVSEWIQINLGFGLRIHLQKRITRHIMQLSFHDISQFPAGKLANYIDQSKLVLDITVQLGSIIRALMMVIAYGVVMFSMSVQLTVATFFVFLILWICLKKVVLQLQRLAKEVTTGEIALWRWTIEFLNAPKLLRLINGTERATKEIDNAWASYLLPERRSDLIAAAIPKALETITVLVAGIFLIGAVLMVSEDRGTVVSSLFVFVLIFFRLRPVIKAFNDLRIKIARIIPRLEVVGYLLKIKISDRSSASTQEFKGLSSSLKFDEVTFRYPGTDRDILSKINLEIAYGATTAIVGRSGSGKTTIADLSLGLYRPTSGRVCIDGVDLRQLNIADWRDSVGVVDQENFLLNTNIIENIRFGRPQLGIEEVKIAAKAAHAEEFIEQLDEGYNTVIGDRGLRLSGGQQQRLALARALVTDPSVLILDEATSALDSVSEKIIQQTIEEIKEGRTIVVIAHRLSTVMSADKIIVIEKGSVVEEGSREELIKNEQQFAKLWLAQTD